MGLMSLWYASARLVLWAPAGRLLREQVFAGGGSRATQSNCWDTRNIPIPQGSVLRFSPQ